jgi:hypothetical protein
MNPKASRERREQRIAFLEAEERLTQLSQSPGSQLRIAAFPDPWLFDSEKLLRELDRIRELVNAIPNNADRHATHFQREIASIALWNLRETLRHLLGVHREGQRDFAKKAVVAAPVAKQTTQTSNRRARA